MTKKYYVIGLDIGGTKVEAALFLKKENGELETHNSLRTPTNRDKGYQDVIKRIANLITDLMKQSDVKGEEVLGIGAGLPGSVDPSSHQMINGNSQIFIGQSFSQDLAKLVGIENIKVANDANLFALAEFQQGAGLRHQANFPTTKEQMIGVGIILGTGCGGGLCLGGRVFSGAHGGGAEVGHSVLKTQGRPCYCGRHGCAEQYLSGSSVEKAYQESKGQAAPSLRTSEIFTAADRRDIDQETKDLCLSLLKEYQNDLSEFLTNLTAVFDPHFFVLGGGVSTIEEIYIDLEESLWEKLFVKGSKPKVYKHQVGDSAGALGGALLI